MLFRTNVALSVRGDRLDKGADIDLTPDEVAHFDPSDITALGDIPAPEEEDAEPVAFEDMNVAQLRERAKELGLSAAGSKADLTERIQLHLDGHIEETEPAEEEDAPEEEENLSEPNQ